MKKAVFIILLLIQASFLRSQVFQLTWQQVWNIRKTKPGIYINTLKAGAFSKSGKLIVE
jgi:hypothetical protein